VFLVLFYRFFSIQIIGGEEYTIKSDMNRIRERILTPIRGQFYDRNRVLLVDNVPAYSISVIPYELKNKEFLYSFVEENFPEELDNVKEKLQSATAYRPVKILHVDLHGLALFEENKLEMPGVFSQIEPQRDYPSGINASHFFGYIKEIDEDEIESFGTDYYRSGDIIGKDGLEKQYESYLKGEKGIKYIEVDALGQEMGEIITNNSANSDPGNNLILTFDRDLQIAAEQALEGKRGAVIALDPNTGEILTAVSKPDYDPFFMNRRLTPEEWNSVLNDTTNPLSNRATQGFFPPGSTFKLVAAIAVLNDSIITPDYRYYCNGVYQVGRRPYHCHNLGGHGNLNMIEAIEQSCNVYFYNLAFKHLDIDVWSKYGKLFKFGESSGLDTPEERSGILPDRKFLDERYLEGWTKGNVVNQIIGQGDVITTPLQMARFAGIIATKGKITTPHFLKAVYNTRTDSLVYEYEIKTEQIDIIRDEVWNTVRQGMHDVVHGERGTARRVRRAGVLVGGKTGTAQNAGEDHAWFIGFAPFDDPEIAICTFVENGGGGGANAAPVATDVLKRFFDLKKEREKVILSAEIDK
ncbi:MAG: penicillin-binding protein 2, partial [bacterium]|nr:penicillin-binding protein 2 [bacterium]